MKRKPKIRIVAEKRWAWRGPNARVHVPDYDYEIEVAKVWAGGYPLIRVTLVYEVLDDIA